MKKIMRLAAAAAIGAALAGMHGPAVAQDRDPFGFYGFYYGQCARDPATCRAQRGCVCDKNLEATPPDRVAPDKRSDAAPPITIRVR